MEDGEHEVEEEGGMKGVYRKLSEKLSVRKDRSNENKNDTSG